MFSPDDSSRHSMAVVVIAMAVLLLLSVCPWSRLTNNVVKDFNLFSDLFPEEPELIETEDFGMADDGFGEIDPPAVIVDSMAVDTVAVADTVVVAQPDVFVEDIAVEVPERDGIVIVESYLADGAMFPHFREAIRHTGSRVVRVAVVGDSFIEGDILCQDLRDIWQERYGGEGVGYMSMHSDFPGFRKSVRQSDSGWKMRDVRTMSRRDTVRPLSGEYAVGSSGARAIYEGTSFSDRTRQWSRSTVLLMSSAPGTVTITTDAGKEIFEVSKSGDVQVLSMDGSTKRFRIDSNVDGLVVLGAYLDPVAGMQVDCMSVRGTSGLHQASTDAGLVSQISAAVPYDLIIVEYGINALSAEQKNYTAYGQGMADALSHLKSLYQNTDILVLGISDRGTKSGTSVTSLATCEAMVKAQRAAARKAGVHFWDTRQAMGGKNSVVDWHRRKLINSDYVHLNHKGGGEMARLLDRAIHMSINE